MHFINFVSSLCRVAVAVAAIGVVELPIDALAADLPIKAPPLAAVAPSGGFYFWADGSYQSIPLPTYALGFKASPGFGNGPIVDTYSPRVTGYGASGAFG